MAKITMELSDLRNLLDEQIKLTANTLKSGNARYNAESTEGQQFSLKINEEKFFKVASETRYVNDYTTLLKYLGG